MLRAALWTLRQRRYAGLAALMVVVALMCIGAGTFEITRYQQKNRDNGALVANAHASAVPLSTGLVPLVGQGPAPSRKAIAYRTATASGTYQPGGQTLLTDQSLDGTNGFYVVTPLRTGAGTLLVVRGFVAAGTAGAPPATVAAPPAGIVRITGWLDTGSTKQDGGGALPAHQVLTINPGAQAARLGTPVYNGYLTLTKGQPGTAGVTALPAPSLSNPTGGASAWQLFSYVIQWYFFAALALAAPFVMARYEVREARRRYLGIDEGERELALDHRTPPRAELAGGSGGALASGAEAGGAESADAGAGGGEAGGALATRGDGALLRRSEAMAARWQRAERLADRYGRSLGPADLWARAGALDESEPDLELVPPETHPPHDPYRGKYNDYLWELALADGSAPPVDARRIDESEPSQLPGDTDADPAPKIIEGTPTDRPEE